MNAFIRHMTVAFCLLFTTNVLAQVKPLGDTPSHLTLEITERYIMGDNDTLIDAKNLSIEQAKKTAADYAGTYVEQSLTVDGNKISQQEIRVLTAGFLEVLKSIDSRQLDESGTMTLTTVAVIRLSKESIKDGLAKLKSDPERQTTIKKLEQENEQLRTDLVRLSQQINQSQAAGSAGLVIKPRPELIEQRDGLLKQLEHNRASVRQVFAQGTLFQMAKQGNRDYERAQKRLAEQFFAYFKYNTEITLGDPEFVDNGNGTYDMRVFVTWNTPFEPTAPLWDDYFNIFQPSAYNDFTASLHTNRNRKNEQKQPFTKKLYDELTSKNLYISVSAGGYSAELPIATLDSDYNYRYKIQFQGDKETRQYVHLQVENPVTLKGIPAAVLNSLTAINADVVVKPVTQ